MKAILYCRKSTDTKDKQVMSLDAQAFELKAVASRENIVEQARPVQWDAVKLDLYLYDIDTSIYN